MADWPATLPCAFIRGTHQRMQVKTYDEFQPDQGRPLRARKYTGQTWEVAGECVMTRAQLATLDTFYETTTGGGTDRFNMDNHMTFGDPLVVMFKEPYGISEMGALYRVSLSFTMWDGSAGA